MFDCILEFGIFAYTGLGLLQDSAIKQWLKQMELIYISNKSKIVNTPISSISYVTCEWEDCDKSYHLSYLKEHIH